MALQQFEAILRPSKSAVDTGDARVLLDMPYGALASWGDFDSMSQAPQQHLLILWRGELAFMVA